MEKDLPKSKNVKLLIRRMEPDKKYFPFQLREVTKLEHKSLYSARRLAQDYGLIRQEHLSGRLYLYTLTEKGKEYRVPRKIRRRYYKLPTEKREKIMELLEKGMSITEISRTLGIPRSTVYDQRPDVKERRREYYQRPEVKDRRKEYIKVYYQKPDPDFQEFQKLVQETEKGLDSIKFPEDNVYFSILRCLCEGNFGIKYKQLKKRIGKNVTGNLRKLKEEEIVDYKDKRYRLKNKELCKLFSPYN
jgi:predicted DNA-binding protein YlxM (UPF0122 family)